MCGVWEGENFFGCVFSMLGRYIFSQSSSGGFFGSSAFVHQASL